MFQNYKAYNNKNQRIYYLFKYLKGKFKKNKFLIVTSSFIIKLIKKYEESNNKLPYKLVSCYLIK